MSPALVLALKLVLFLCFSSFKITYDGKSERSLKELAVLDSSYGEIARYIIWGDPSQRLIIDWVAQCNVTEMLINIEN